MKGMAVRTIGFAILAVFSLGLIMALLTGFLDVAPITCFVYRTFSSVNPDVEFPEYCLTDKCVVERETIKATDPEGQAANLAAYAIACYTSESPPCPKAGDSVVCYELRLPNGLLTTELEMTALMERDYESGCMLLPNSMIGSGSSKANYPGSCGDKDGIDWQLRGNEAMVVIEYNMTSQTIVLR